MEKFIAILKTALNVLATIAPDFNPLKGHLASDNITGSSRFYEQVKDMEDVLNLISTATNIEMFPAWGGAVGFAVHTAAPCGLQAWSAPVEGADYEVKMWHGCLQAFGPVTEETAVSNVFTIILTPEDTADGKRFALASIYPGIPDVEPNREDLAEGQHLTAADVRARNLRPKQA